MTFDELEAKGLALVEKRNKASGSGRAILNREIVALRQAQIMALKEEIIKGLSIAMPELINQTIQSSDVVKAIEELQRGE
ncbi:TPA: hypothetical protein HIP68_004605 [Escherichia coli]|nr:hypothetical protein [Escherichia coli]